jgi:hypothetical protein
MDSRDIINIYIKEHEVKLGQYIDKQDMINWGMEKFPTDRERTTLDARIIIMTTNEPNRLHNHLREDGADDILYRDEKGLRLYDRDNDPAPIRDEDAHLPEHDTVGILVRWNPFDWNHKRCLENGSCSEEFTSIGKLSRVTVGMKVVILCTHSHGVKAVGEVTGEVSNETWEANHWSGKYKMQANSVNKRRAPISIKKAFIHSGVVEINPLLKKDLHVVECRYLSAERWAEYEKLNKFS